MWPNQQETAGLVTFTEENLNGMENFISCAVTHTLFMIFLTSGKFLRISLLLEYSSNTNALREK